MIPKFLDILSSVFSLSLSLMAHNSQKSCPITTFPIVPILETFFKQFSFSCHVQCHCENSFKILFSHRKLFTRRCIRCLKYVSNTMYQEQQLSSNFSWHPPESCSLTNPYPHLSFALSLPLSISLSSPVSTSNYFFSFYFPVFVQANETFFNFYFFL